MSDKQNKDEVFAIESFRASVQHVIFCVMKKKRISQKRLSELLKCHYLSINQLFSDDANPSLETLARIFFALGEEPSLTCATYCNFMRSNLKDADATTWQPIETAPKDVWVSLGWWQGDCEWVTVAGIAAYNNQATHWMPLPSPPTDQAVTKRDLHPETSRLIDRFAEALKDKLAAAQKKYGYSDGWMNSDWQADLIEKLQSHVIKGDPRDVAAYCAFAWHHEWSVTPAQRGD